MADPCTHVSVCEPLAARIARAIRPPGKEPAGLTNWFCSTAAGGCGIDLGRERFALSCPDPEHGRSFVLFSADPS